LPAVYTALLTSVPVTGSKLSVEPDSLYVTSYFVMGAFDPPGTHVTRTEVPPAVICVIDGALGTSEGTPNTGSDPMPVDPSLYFGYTTKEYCVPLLNPVNSQERVLTPLEHSVPADDVTR
jgi:hypothetical protein